MTHITGGLFVLNPNIFDPINKITDIFVDHDVNASFAIMVNAFFFFQFIIYNLITYVETQKHGALRCPSEEISTLVKIAPATTCFV